MLRWFPYLVLTLCLCRPASPLLAQNYLDRGFYLVDSLGRNDLSPVDEKLLDSILTRFHSEKRDTVKTRLLYDLVENCYNDRVWPKYNLYLKTYVEQLLSRQDLDKKTRLSHRKMLSACYNNMGYLSKQKGRIDRALALYAKARQILDQVKDHEGLATNYNNVGYIYFDQGNIPLAIEYFHKSLEHYRLSSPRNPNAPHLLNQTAVVYNNLGLLYSKQTDYQRALTYYQQSLDLKLKTGEPSGLALAYGNLGSIYIMQNKKLCPAGDEACRKRYFDKGMAYLRTSIAWDAKIANEPSIARTYHNVAMGFTTAGQTDSAVFYLEKSIGIKRFHRDIYGLCLSLTNLGEIQAQRGDVAAARKNAEEAYRYAMQLGFPDAIAMSAQMLSIVSEKQNRYKEALDFYRTFIKMRDSTINEKNTREAVQRDMAFEYRKKQTTDSIANARQAEIKDAQIQAQQSQLNSERNKKIAMLTGLVSVLLMLLLIYTRFRSAQKQKNIIQEQKNLVEEKQREIIDSIQYAQRLQNAILAKETEIKTAFPGFFLLYMPKDIVAGDFYFFEQTATHVFCAAADCTGHGVPGALVSVVCSNALSRSINEFGLTEPGKILDKAREIVLETFKKSGEHVRDGMDISLISVGRKDLEALEQNAAAACPVSWAGANNALLLHSAAGNGLSEIQSDKQPVGYTEKPRPFTTHTIVLQKGDALYMYTDGFHDQFGGPKGKKFKKVNLHQLLGSHAGLLPDAQKTALRQAFDAWKGTNEQVDDVCIIGIKL